MLSDKKYARIKQKLGEDKLVELEALSVEQLESAVTSAEMAIKQADDQLEASPAYRELKLSVAAVMQAKGDVNRRQRAIAAYALHLIEEKGKA